MKEAIWKSVCLVFTFGIPNAGLANTKPECAFCARGLHQTHSVRYEGFRSPEGTANFFSSLVVDESEHFVLKVTRGAFVPFYFLIISKEHFNRVADLPLSYFDELESFKAKVEQFYRDALKSKFVVFEHGSSVCSGHGACVDHLHLHILPFAGDIEGHPDLNLPTRFRPPRRITALAHLSKRPSSYVYYQNPAGQMKVYDIVDWVPSQLLRLLIAEAQGFGEDHNWREFEDRGDFMDHAAQSISGYQTWKLFGAHEAAARIAEKKLNERSSGRQEPLLFSGGCESLLRNLERYKSERGSGTVGEFAAWFNEKKSAK